MNRDVMLRKIENLRNQRIITWYPWIGQNYSYGGMLVVGESNYVKDDLGATPDEAVAVVNGNSYFTQEVVKRVSISHKQANRTFDAITYLLKRSDGSNVKDVSAKTWNSFAYMDVIQCAMMGRGWSGATARKAIERPSPSLWKPGWNALYSVINIIKPSKLVFVGASLYYYSKHQFLPNGIDVQLRNDTRVNRLWLRSGTITLLDGRTLDVVCIPNPGGAHGFKIDVWRLNIKARLKGWFDRP